MLGITQLMAWFLQVFYSIGRLRILKFNWPMYHKWNVTEQLFWPIVHSLMMSFLMAIMWYFKLCMQGPFLVLVARCKRSVYVCVWNVRWNVCELSKSVSLHGCVTFYLQLNKQSHRVKVLFLKTTWCQEWCHLPTCGPGVLRPLKACHAVCRCLIEWVVLVLRAYRMVSV